MNKAETKIFDLENSTQPAGLGISGTLCHLNFLKFHYWNSDGRSIYSCRVEFYWLISNS